MSLKKLRDAFASAFDSLDPDEEVLEQCPDSEVLYNAYHGMLTTEENERVTDHMARCPVCAEAYRLARSTPPPSTERVNGPRR